MNPVKYFFGSTCRNFSQNTSKMLQVNFTRRIYPKILANSISKCFIGLAPGLASCVKQSLLFVTDSLCIQLYS